MLDIKECNNLVLEKLSKYLNNNSTFITEKMITNLIKECNVTKEEAYRFLLAEALEIDTYKNRELFNEYFIKMVKHLDINKYKNNPYNKNISLKNISNDNYKIEIQTIKAYEAFVYNDLEQENGKIIPQIGFFDEEYTYPAILENNREWMLITPNEIETMQEVIDNISGIVLTYGLGLGYFAYMASLKEEVKQIYIVEKDKNVIELFNKYILPQFKNSNKIIIINDDALTFSKTKPFKYDYVFADIWHDPSDGIELYKKLKQNEIEGVKYYYWIEKTIKCYI